MNSSDLAAQVIGGAASLVGLPAMATAAFTAAGLTALGEYQRVRLERAREIIVRRLAKGKAGAITDDQAAAALFTYLRAAQEGAARRNLEAMAEALSNAVQEPTFTPNTFRRHSLNLASLTREEAHALAIFMTVRCERRRLEIPEKGEPNAWSLACELATNGNHIFGSIDEFQAVSVALLRTGYLRPLSLYGSMGFGPTLLLDEVARLVDMDEILQTADADGRED